LLRKVLILLLILLFSVIACGKNQNEFYEPIVSKDKIEFPFEEIEDGTMLFIFRNYDSESINLSLLLVSQNELLNNSQTKDFCEEINLLKNGKNIADWIPINFNIAIIPEESVENQNDHPNLISYNLPLGTYLLMLQNTETCNKDNYKVFNVLTNKAFED